MIHYEWEIHDINEKLYPSKGKYRIQLEKYLILMKNIRYCNVWYAMVSNNVLIVQRV